VDADLIVVGAGAAGLAAARSLARHSVRVQLVEARDRIGGRVFSYPIAGIPTPAELGAEFIHGSAAQTRALLREAGSAAIDMGGEAWSRERGELARDDKRFFEAAGIFEAALSLPNDESVDGFLQRFATDPQRREIASSAREFVEGFEAADPGLASVRAIAEEIGTGVDSTSARPLGGYAPIFHQLRNDCAAAGVELHLSTVVRRIVWGPNGVAIDVLDSRGAVRTLEARAAILTLPVGVLRHRGDECEIVFEPELPHPKRKALASIEMGHVVKVALWFRTAFWEAIDDGRYRDGAFFYVEGEPIPTYWTQLPVRSELAAAWVGGPRAVALANRSPAELVGAALDGFGALFNARDLARREFEDGTMHDWSNDRFARGAYSYVAVNGGDARARLAAPLANALFFAGEATSSDGQGGTVNGALETGERAAAEAAAALGVKADA
jgi:monoamine oxidase